MVSVSDDLTIDGGPVMAGDAQVAGEGLQQFDLVGQDEELNAAVWLEVDPFAIGAQTGERWVIESRSISWLPMSWLAHFGGFGFVHAQDDLGAGRAGQGNAAFAAINALELRNVLQAEHKGKPALPAAVSSFSICGWCPSDASSSAITQV
jgi:hypothetical protein